MTKTYCDRCGKGISFKAESNVSITVYDEDGDRIDSESRDYDLCPECTEVVKTVAAPKREVKNG